MGECRLLLFSYYEYLIAKMQSVVAGQAPITLEWKIKITSGGKNNQIKRNIIMRRASEASLVFLGFSTKKKPLHNGSYEHRVPKKTKKTIHYSVPGICVIKHRN